MSGSGPESRSGGWGGGGDASDCDFEIASTTLRSTVGDVVEKLNDGDVLPIEVDEDVPAVLVKRGQAIVGSIIERVPKFVACFKAGFRYEAEVLNVDGASVTVRTRQRH